MSDRTLTIELEPDIHELWIQAKDYACCVMAMQADSNSMTLVINSQAVAIVVANPCPFGWAYSGRGDCQQVEEKIAR